MVCQWDRNPEISLSSRNNPEMSQHSSDLPMLANFSIYIYIYIYFPDIFSELAGIVHGVFGPKKLISHRDPLKSETFNKSQLS